MRKAVYIVTAALIATVLLLSGCPTSSDSDSSLRIRPSTEVISVLVGDPVNVTFTTEPADAEGVFSISDVAGLLTAGISIDPLTGKISSSSTTQALAKKDYEVTFTSTVIDPKHDLFGKKATATISIEVKAK